MTTTMKTLTIATIVAGLVILCAGLSKAETIEIKGCQGCDYKIQAFNQVTKAKSNRQGTIDGPDGVVHLGTGNMLYFLELNKGDFNGRRSQSPRVDPTNPIYKVTLIKPSTFFIECVGANTPHDPNKPPKDGIF